jgi:hypothetical protein
MTSSDFIRWSGLAAVIGGGLYSALSSLLGFRAPLLYTLLALGAMAATVALHALQKRHYGSPGALASLTTFVGLAMVFASAPARWLGWPVEGAAIILLLLGLLATFAGMLALGAVTVRGRVMPLWCGVALLVGSLGFGGGLVGDWVLGASGTGYFVAVALLQGVPWIVVGYAIFRAAGRRTQQPSRVR